MKFADLYCGEGGAAEGLHQAFPDAEIHGFDIEPMPRYPFIFHQANVFDIDWNGYDFIWASPPCQGYSVMRHLAWNQGKDYPLLIESTRDRLLGTGQYAHQGSVRCPWIIENVEGARRNMPNRSGKYLCGLMFGKRFYRHRLFESNFLWLSPPHPKHTMRIRPGHALAGRARDILFSEPRANTANGTRSLEAKGWSAGLGHQPNASLARAEMGVEWMSSKGMSQAVPVCYARHLAQFIPKA